MRNCVIHRKEVFEETIYSENSVREKALALQAHRVIEDIIAKDPNVVLIDDKDPASVADLFNKGDSVILYGAYRQGCLETAMKVLKAKGIKVEYHSAGTIPKFPIHGYW